MLNAQLGKIAQITSQPAGLHLVIRLPDACDDQRLAALAGEQGTTVRALSDYYIGPPASRGLVVGFGYAPPDKLATHGRMLGHAVRAGLKR